MIYVAFGTHERPFYRLAKEIGVLIKKGKIKERVIIQLGFTDYRVKGAECHKFIKLKKMEKYIETCKIMITHGGLGSIVRAIRAGKAVVVIPRRKMFDEHTDDHQLQIVEEAKKLGNVIPVHDTENLESAIRKAKKVKVRKKKYKPSGIIKLVNKKLKEWN